MHKEWKSQGKKKSNIHKKKKIYNKGNQINHPIFSSMNSLKQFISEELASCGWREDIENYTKSKKK